jgi:transketolase
MRDGFKSAILARAKLDPSFHVLTGDHGYALFDEFALHYPNRFHNVGVAEANLVGLAAGMARNGMTPLIYGLSAFIPNRVFEFIKLQIAAENLPVTMVGDGGGLVYSTLGISHQTLEDLAIIGSLESVHSLAPGSANEMERAIHWAGYSRAPTYIRMGKSGGIYQESSHSMEPSPHLIHDAQILGNKKSIIAHGSMVSIALELVKQIPDIFDVWSCPTISPMPSSFIGELSSRYSQVVVIEEHGVHGGLGSRILLGLANSTTTVHLIGSELDQKRTTGSWEWALHIHGLSQVRIVQRLRSIGFLI